MCARITSSQHHRNIIVVNMSKHLVNLFMLKTRLLVNLYTATTLPFYYLAQKPWRTVALAKQIKSKKLLINGSWVWVRNEEPPEHPHLKCGTYVQVMDTMIPMYGPKRPALAYRQVLQEHTQKNPDGSVVRVDGKILTKYQLSDYKWLTLEQVMQRVHAIANALTSCGAKKGQNILIFADTRVEWFLCSLAVMKIGATLVTLFSTLGTQRILSLLSYKH